MNVVDSSAWLEYFSGGSNSSTFAKAIEDVDHLLVPSVCLLEVFKKILSEHGETVALEKTSYMHQGKIIDLDGTLALSAAKLSFSLKLPLADSIVLATARMNDAILWTQDSDFDGMDGVQFFPKSKKK